MELDYEPRQQQDPKPSWLPTIIFIGIVLWMLAMFITNHGD